MHHYIPAQHVLAGCRLVQVEKIILPSLCFSFFKIEKEQKRAENKSFTSGQAGILFWKREVCGSFSSRPSKEPEGDALCSGLGGGYLWTFCGCPGSPEPQWWIEGQLSASLPFGLCPQVARALPQPKHAVCGPVCLLFSLNK